MGITIVVGNIFHAPLSHAFALGVSEDLCMNNGFAKVLKAKFGCVDSLKEQGLTVGNVGVVKFERTILFMISKDKSSTVSTMNNVYAVLICLRDVCESLGFFNISYPNNGLDYVLQKYVFISMKKIFDKSKVNIFLWRFKSGISLPSASLLLPNVMLAGDSNFLRVLNSSPNTRQGHVISGGNLLSIQYSLLRSLPTEHLFFMGGTNDLLFFHKEKLSKRNVSVNLRALLKRLMKIFGRMSNLVTVLTIPPCPLLDDSGALFNVNDFNQLLNKFASSYGYSVLDVNKELSVVGSSAIDCRDRLHLSKVGVEVVRQCIVQFLNKG